MKLEIGQLISDCVVLIIVKVRTQSKNQYKAETNARSQLTLIAFASLCYSSTSACSTNIFLFHVKRLY